MADVQLEKGYTRIANEILEAIARIKLSPTAYRLITVIWRYTYGFNRKEAELSLSFLANATLCDKRQIQRELKRLDEQSIISQNITSGVKRVISFNKDFSMWVGEIAIGEIDNGETTIGESVNSTIGEIVKGTIGETTNQERQYINTTLKTITHVSYNSRFSEFWKAYPKKVGKGAAEKAFKKYKPNDALLATMLKTIETQKQSEQWKKDSGQYIPNPATWLNQKRWEDEAYTLEAKEDDSWGGIQQL